VNEILSASIGGGAVATILTLLVRATLALLRSQGEQMREWQQIVDAKDRQIEAKDRQLEQVEHAKNGQIAELRESLAERDQRIQRLEARVAELEREVRGD
jgi:predicted RNase H-like nuclease (RuvC/YqgF family)